MSGVNKAIIVGRLGKDPELRYTGGGTPVVNMSVATSENYKDKEGQKQEKTEWHRIVMFGKMAEVCAKYLQKGRQVYLEGRIQTRSWENKDGVKQYTTEIVANAVQFLGSKPEGSGGSQGSQDSGRNYDPGAGFYQSMAEPDFSDDDIPF